MKGHHCPVALNSGKNNLEKHNETGQAKAMKVAEVFSIALQKAKVMQMSSI